MMKRLIVKSGFVYDPKYFGQPQLLAQTILIISFGLRV